MKIAVSSTGTDLGAQVDPRFGRCQHFIIVDPDTMEFEAVENSGAMSAGGAGIATGQLVAGKGAGAVLTGNCGPNAFNVLEAAGIKVMTGVSGTVQDAVEGYKSGKYQANSQASVAPHSGMGER
ncbi:NifB/NifX family molybdenum-iron cluster-binding protein [Chloroflexota bacterium]